MGNLEMIKDAVVKGDAILVISLVEQCLTQGLLPEQIITNGLLAGVEEVGEQFEEGIIYIPHLLLSSRAAQAGMHVIRKFIPNSPKIVSRVVIGTVMGDVHDIGKNLVAMALQGQSLEVIDVGVDVHPEEFVNAVERFHPEIVALSSSLTTTMYVMKDVIRAIRTANIRIPVKVIVGGGHVTKEYACSIGADGYASNCWEAANLSLRLVGRNSMFQNNLG